MKFFTRIDGALVFLTAEGLIVDLSETEMMKMQFMVANPSPKLTGEILLDTRSNYLIGDNPSRWTRQVPHYERVRYHDIYPGIDVVFYFREGHLEYDFVLSPAADPDSIRLEFTGMDELAMNL
ncbi:MAG: hypothetical protein GTO60_02680, partial [Gammaproteobacteria bacterium]|nr:hypothetical protein [Gammaproteobacteria bacterium]